MGSLVSKSSPKSNKRQKGSITSGENELKVSGFSEDLENWMRDLPPKLKTTPIIHLAIPGEHENYYI